jgi:hypothetical protein
MRRRLGVASLIACCALGPGIATNADADRAFARFWSATNLADAAKAADDVVRSGVSFDEAIDRLRQGRTYAKDTATGVVEGRHGEFSYTLEVPAAYDAARRHQVRIQLHGGVMRDLASRRGRGRGVGRLAGAEQIYILPAGWNEAPWWSAAQLDNLRTILDTVKRTYNVDENHIVVTGVSDGGTGAYYVAMRDTTPYASFLPLNGYLLVLQNDPLNLGGDLFPGNLRNKPLFIVNGGRDPLYPLAIVEPSILHLSRGGVPMVYEPQPQAGHDTSWWPVVKDDFEAFVRTHPRAPLPDRLTWETGDTRAWNRAHWLIVDALGSTPHDARDLPDLNQFTPPPAADMGARITGVRVEHVDKGTMADRAGLRAGDTIEAVGEARVANGVDLINALQPLTAGSPLGLTVRRDGHPLELSGTFDPKMVQQPSAPIFRHGRSGRVDLERSGNTVTARTRGVGEFTLLLSPDQFDFARPVKVIVNGRAAYDARVEPSVATLMKWAARDNDRTMLFGAEIHIKP